MTTPDRWTDPARAFLEHYGSPATLAVRAPGRVNLIGDHIDYCGLPVLPMALQHAVILLARPRDDREIRLHNSDPRYPPTRFALEREIVPAERGHWSNYARAAAQGLVGVHGPLWGFDGWIASDLAPAAGLSSSSALLIATALALLARNDLATDREPLMELLARSERYVGTAGGGMDQAVILGAQAGSALRVAFTPLALSPIPIPPTWRFVVAPSLVPAEKSGAVQEEYNRRTRETAEALRRVVAGLRLAPETNYRALLDQRDPETLVGRAADLLDGSLLRRFRHVVTEGDRVRQAEIALQREDRTGFGRLMTASHASLRDDFGVSHHRLDELVEAAAGAGAAGARLTGAGFGGCVVALTDEGGAERLIAALRPRGGTDPAAEGPFVARPSGGAQVQRL